MNNNNYCASSFIHVHGNIRTWFPQISAKSVVPALPRLKRANPFETRTARFKHLKTGVYHQTTVDEKIYLLYRRGKKKSMWYVRTGKEQKPLGLADDHQGADGKDILTYFQAAKRAIKRAREARTTERPIVPRRGHTVRGAAEAYFEYLEAKGRKSVGETRRIAQKDIYPSWGSTALEDVTATRIQRWLTKLQRTPPKTRAGKYLELDTSPEGLRRRRATAQRKWAAFRAILNHGVRLRWTTGHEWVRFGNLDNIDPPQDDFPTIAECKRLARRANKEFRPIIEATFLTGAAYRELCDMKVRDYTPSTGHVRVFNSKRRPRHIPLTEDGIALFDELTAGKGADDFIFTRKDGRPWRTSQQARPLAEANRKAKLNPRITLTRLRKAYGSALLNHGVPLEVVAQAMGHADTRVTRQHYARLLQETVDEQIRAALPSLGGKRKVTRIKR